MTRLCYTINYATKPKVQIIVMAYIENVEKNCFRLMVMYDWGFCSLLSRKWPYEERRRNKNKS